MQVQSCLVQQIGSYANYAAMTGIEQDIALVRSLIEWVGTNANQVSKEISVANTTLNRFNKGNAKTRLSRAVYDKLRAKYPDFPGWNDERPLAAAPAGDEIPPSNAAVIEFEGHTLETAEENLPVWGTGLGAAKDFDGEAIEQTTLNTGDVLDYVKRPAILKGRKMAYALHVQGSSMHPALPEGEFVVACREMPLSVGDNVVVYIRDGQSDDGQRARAVLVKELVRRSASYVELRQYDPPRDFRVATSEVLRIDRILTRREMLT